MPTLNIEGRRVTVDDSFLQLSPEEQNATVEEIAREMQVRPGGGAQEDAGSTLGGTIQQFGESFNRGLYGFANLPTTLANMATGAAGVDFQFKRPLEAIAPGMDREIMTVPEPQGPAENVAGYVGDFMGANAIPGAGMIGAAPRIAAATANATGLGGQSVNRMASGIASAPGTAATGELLSSAGSGIGASMAEGAGPNAEYLASLAGGVLAPAALAIAPTNMARKGINYARKKVSPAAVEKAQRRQFTDQLRQNMTPGARQAIDDTMAIQRDVPDYRPSLAEATENPAYIATQRALEQELSGPELDRAIARYRSNDAAIAAARENLAPQSPLDADDAFRTGARRVQALSNRLDDRLTRVDAEASDIADNLRAGPRTRELGATIRDDLIGRRSAIKAEMSETAQRLGLNDERARFPFMQAKERLKAAVKPRSDLSDRSALPGSILNDIDAAPDSVSIVDLTELRSRISADIREASRTPQGEKRVPYLQALKSELDTVTDDLIHSVDDPQMADNLANFRRMYREDYIQPFEQGAAARALKTDASGAYVVPDERVAREFFNGWNQSAADQFNRVFPSSANAAAAMEAAALDDLHSFAVRNGIIDPTAFQTWTRKNSAVLEAFPNIRQNVGNTEAALNRLASRRATLLNRRKQIENSVLARELSRIENATTTPENVIATAIRNPSRMAKIMSGVKTKAAKSAIAREAWKTALESGDPAKFLSENQSGMARALGSEKLKTAQRLARAIEKNRLVARPSGQAMDTNPMASVEGVMGTGLNQISSRIFAVKSGRTSARYALADIAGRAFRTMTGNQARDMLQQALYDPQIATDLANAIEFGGKQTTPAAMKRLYTFILSNGIATDTREEGQTMSDPRLLGQASRQPLELTVTPQRQP